MLQVKSESQIMTSMLSETLNVVEEIRAKLVESAPSASTNKPMPKLPTLEESLHRLHDGDWGWVDSQSYWYGARSMYNRISRQLSA